MASRELVVAVFADGAQFEKFMAADGPKATKVFTYAVEDMARKNVAAMAAQQAKLRELQAEYVRMGAAAEKGSAQAVAASTLLADTNRKLASSSGATAAAMERVAAKSVLVGRSLSTYITAPLLIVGALATKTFINFQRQMEMIHTQAGASQGEVSKLTPQVLNLAQTSAPQGPVELSKGLYHLESVGLRGAAAMKALKIASDAAGVGIASIEETATGLGGVLVTNIKGAQNYSQAMGTINATIGAGNMRMADFEAALRTGVVPAFKDAGLSLTDFGASLAVLTDRGMPAQLASTRLRMTVAMIEKPTKAATKALGDLGIAPDQLAKLLQKPGGMLMALELLKAGMDRLKDPIRANGDLLAAFGRGRSSAAIQSLVGSLDSAVSSFQGKSAQIKANQKNFAEDVAAYHKTASYKISHAWASVQASMVKLGGVLAPAFTKIATGVAALAKGIEKLPTPVKYLVGGMILFAGAMGPVLLIGGKLAQVFTGVGKIVIELGRIAGVQFGLMEGETIALSATMKAALISTGIGAVIVAVGVMTAYTITHWKQVKGWLEEFGAWLKSHSYVLFALPVVGQIAFMTVEVIKHWKEIKNFVKGVGEFFATVFTHPIRAIETAFSNLADWMKRQFQGILHTVGSILAAIPSWLPGIGKFHSWGVKLENEFGTIGSSSGQMMGKNFADQAQQWINTVSPPAWLQGNMGTIPTAPGQKVSGKLAPKSVGAGQDFINNYLRTQGWTSDQITMATRLMNYEDGSGGPGDNNSSFGPRQLHVGGQLPDWVAKKGPAFAQKWAWSPAGLMYAAKGIAGFGNLHGAALADALARKQGSTNPARESWAIQSGGGGSVYDMTGTGPINASNNPMANQLHAPGSLSDTGKMHGIGLLPVALQKEYYTAEGNATSPAGKAALAEVISKALQYLESQKQTVKVLKEEATLKKQLFAAEKSHTAAISGLGLLPKSMQKSIYDAQGKATSVEAQRTYIALLQAALKKLATEKQSVKVTKEEASLREKIHATQTKITAELKKSAAAALKAQRAGITAAEQSILGTGDATTVTRQNIDVQLKYITDKIKATGTPMSAATQSALDKVNEVLKFKFIPASVRASIKQQLDGIQTDTETVLTGMANDLKQQLDSVWGSIVAGIDSQFSEATQQTTKAMQDSMNDTVSSMQAQLATALQNMQIMVQSSAGAFLFGGAITQTPAEIELAKLEKDHRDKQQQDQLAADQQRGDQTAIANDLYDIKITALQDQAAIERDAATQQLQDAKDNYQKQIDAQIKSYQDEQQVSIDAYAKQRALEQTQMDEQLKIEFERFSNGTVDADTFKNDVNTILTQHGVDTGRLSYIAGVNLVQGLLPGINAAIDLWNAYARAKNAAEEGRQSDHVSANNMSPPDFNSQRGTIVGGHAVFGFAEGGIVTGRSPILSMIGEAREPEMIMPLSRAHEFGFGAGGGSGIHVHFEGPVFGDMRKIGRELEPYIRNAIIQAQKRNTTSGIR